MTEACMIYVPCTSTQEAEVIGKALLAERSIACANILPPMRSLYVWQEELCQSEEVILLLKSFSAQWDKVCGTILRLHSYDTPCILRLPVGAAHPPYLDWMAGSIKPPQG